MSVYVKGYGTFDPALPDFLVEKDGKLYNKNATNNQGGLVEEWTPPAGWRGGDGVTFTPESAPAPAPVVSPAPWDEDFAALSRKLFAAMRAVVAHDAEALRAAEERVAAEAERQQQGLRLAVAAEEALDEVLKYLAGKAVNPQ